MKGSGSDYTTRLSTSTRGPETWGDLDGYEFLVFHGFNVLLPIPEERHLNVKLLRHIVSEDGNVLTLFLKETTFDEGVFAGRAAVCDRFEGEEFIVADPYHECFVIRSGKFSEMT